MGAYGYTPAVWLPLAAAVFLIAIGLYSWHRRDMPGARWLAAGTLLGVLWLAAIALQLAAIDPNTKIFWRTFEAAIRLPAISTTLCFALDYAFPGRWLTRRTLFLLAAVNVACVLVFSVGSGRLAWQSAAIGADGLVVISYTLLGQVLVAGGYILIVVSLAAFLWLFVRSPQHRWPVAIMLFGWIAASPSPLLLSSLRPGSLPATIALVAGIFLVWATYAIALFGFRILDPLPFARRAVLDQMHAGAIVFDAEWRILSLNPAAEAILGITADAARGKDGKSLSIQTDLFSSCSSQRRARGQSRGPARDCSGQRPRRPRLRASALGTSRFSRPALGLPAHAPRRHRA